VIKRSIATGLLVGLAFSLTAIYPVLLIFAGPESVFATWPRPLRLLLLILTIAVGLVLFLLAGSLAARRSGVTDPGKGFKAGAISGLVVALIFYVMVWAPTAALAATFELWSFEPRPGSPWPPEEMVLEFLNQVTRIMHLRLDLCLLAGLLIGGIEGAIAGWLRRGWSQPQPSLLDVISAPQPRRRWFASHDQVWGAGLLAGLLGGGVIWLSLTVIFFSQIKADWPAIQAAVMENTDVITHLLFSDMLVNCLGPLFFVAVLGIGALAVILLKDPPRRHLSRFQVVLIAAVPTAAMIFLAVMQMAYSGIGMARYAAWEVVLLNRPLSSDGAPAIDPGAELYVDPELLEWLQQFVQTPEISIPFFYVLPLVLFSATLIVVLFWLLPQAAFYGMTLPLVFRRPVDRAARIVRAIHRQPASLLPRLYGLYANDARAIQVLPHLAFQLDDPVAAEVVAAYHTLSTWQDGTERATAVVRQTLAEQETWRWRAEVGELHRVLEEGLAAKTLAQVTAVEPPPQEVTSTLPVLLARSCEGIGRVLGELKKVERVDDLSTKLIFLNSAQAALLDLRRSTERGSQDCQACETPYPEIAILHALMDFWQGLVLTATRDLQGRADLQATLLAQRTGFAPRVRQCIVVSNQGLNVAQNVRLQVANGEGYRVVEGAEQQVAILGPQESRELEFWLAPDGPQRLRLSWQLTFDDAVDTGRTLEFADAMELLQEKVDHPFQRIFPIPYVTGTPLRSGEMFVGRNDVFEFVREHLLGAYQNNVIVLHGQRRTGKTSILYRLQDVLADTHVAVLVDMQGKAARGTADFLYALSDDIVYALENHNIFVELPERSTYEGAPEFIFRSRFLRSVVDGLDNRNLILMFDEFEELQKRVEDGRLEPEIFAFLRYLMQHEPRLDFLFSGTHKLEELGAEYWSILFNIAAYKRITFLDASEVYRLATEPVAAYGMEYDPLALERIFQVTAGHPYFAQVVCHEMVAYHNEAQRSYITVTCVDSVLERIIERGEAHFKYIWAGATPEEQKVMLALADLLPDAESTATPADVGEELARKGYELPEDDLACGLAHLQAKDIVTRSGPQSSLYRFKIDLIRRWIAITRPAL
jgi:hypothetical protein